MAATKRQLEAAVKAQLEDKAKYEQALATISELDDKLSLKLSDVAIGSRLRLVVPKAIARLEQMIHSKNDNVALGAVKLVLSKTMPDLKAIEITDTNNITGLVIVRADEKIDKSTDIIDGDVQDRPNSNDPITDIPPKE